MSMFGCRGCFGVEFLHRFCSWFSVGRSQVKCRLSIFLELETTLRRPKFRMQLQNRNQTVECLYSIAQSISTMVEISDIEIPHLRDQNDVKILATAIASQSQVLITGDLDLLVLHSSEAIEILTPSDFQQRSIGENQT